MKKYTSAGSLRAAIENQIAKVARSTGTEISRLRRDVAFDRLLVRLFEMSSPPWALKGGYAMQLRIDKARTTKDIDLALKESRLFSEDESVRNEQIHKLLVEQSNVDLGDFFTFLLTKVDMELIAPPEGGIRFHVDARLADKTFEKFLVDIGAGDTSIDPLEQLDSSDLLSFAGILPRKIPAIPREQQFAEKLHAYTLPRPPNHTNSRVKDLIDMNLLINEGLDSAKIHVALRETYKNRDTHLLALVVSPPPSSWGATFAVMADECGLNPDIAHGFTHLESYLKKL